MANKAAMIEARKAVQARRRGDRPGVRGAA